jgi:ABC-2 type transport system ATP-binding protein
MSLIIERLSKKFDQHNAVDSISFSLERGQVVGFLGPNGAGKSTTLKMIAGALTPSEGNITINGIDIQKEPIAAKRLVGYLPESNPLYQDLYVKEYLQFIANIHQLDQVQKRINEVIELLNLGTMQGKKIETLSKGYKQRVGLAAAIIHEPALLLLDEPSSGLDPNQLVEIRKVIKEYSSQAMVLFSSHILQEITAICDRVMVLHEGKLVANEGIQNLMQPTNHLRVTFEEDIIQSNLDLAVFAEVLVRIDKHVLVLKLTNQLDVKKLIMQMALDKGLNIQGLQTEQASLEEIFKLLTH